MKVRTNQKVLRVVRFLMGLRDPAASQILVPYGLTQAELSIAHQLVRAATEPRLNQRKGSGVSPSMLAKLDAIDNHWYPIIKYALLRRDPQIAEWVFLNLPRAQGFDLVITLRTLFGRVRTLADGTSPFGAEGQLAFSVLQDRGLAGETLDEIYDLLDSIEAFGANDTFNPLMYQQAVDKLWGWYLEWGGIARTVIKDTRILRMLGFRRSKGAAHLTPEEEQAELDDQEDTEVDVAAVVPGATANAANGNAAATNGASLNGASSNGAAHA